MKAVPEATMNEFKNQWKIWHKVGNTTGLIGISNLLWVFVGMYVDGKSGLFIVVIGTTFMLILLSLSIAFTSRGDWLYARARDERLRAIYEQENTYGMGI